MKATANNKRCANFGQSAQDFNHSMTNAAVKERAAQAFIQQRKADKAMRNACQDTPLDQRNLTSLLDSQPVLPVKAPTSIMASIASTLRNAAPKVPKIDLKLPGLSATNTSTSQSSPVGHQESTIAPNKEHNSAIIRSNLAPCGVLEDSFENLFATKQRPSLVRRHSDSLLHFEPNGSCENSVPGALLVDFPSKRNVSLASRRSSSLPDVVSFATNSDDDPCSEVGASCRRSSSLLNAHGGLKIPWDLFPSRDDAFDSVERRGSSQKRLVDGLEYLAPGRRGSVLRMFGGHQSD